VGLGLVEGGLRAVWALRNFRLEAVALPYVVDDYGPVPPWADAARVLEPDPALLWRSRAGVERRYVDVFTPIRSEADRVALLRRFRPSLPDSLAHNPTWSIALNSQGFRAREFEVPKPRGRVRVVCLGDSWTFGANVDQDQAYPQRLEKLLRRAYPAADVEVLNLGVFGYSSFQGLTLLRRHVQRLAPDVVVIGFAMNDSSVAGFRDEEVARTAPSPAARVGALAGRSEIVRLARYLVARARREMEDDVERAHGLTPPSAPAPMSTRDGVDVIFRVTADRQAAPEGLFIVGAHPALGALVPNRVAMYDDGTHGDQRAGDG